MLKGCALYLRATVNVEDQPRRPPTGKLGIDLRVANPAVTVNGETLPHPIRPSCPKGKPGHADRHRSGAPVNSFCYKDLKLPRNSNSKGQARYLGFGG